MNISRCFLCGEDFDNLNKFSPDNQHFYHKACFYDPSADDYIEGCLICIRACYSSSTYQEKCRKCENKSLTCPKALSLCNECCSKKLTQDYFIYCDLCKDYHYYKYTTCVQCEKYIPENDQINNIFFYYCNTCTLNKRCQYCNQAIEFGDFVCGNDHTYHICCIKKRPPKSVNCDKCMNFYTEMMMRYINSNTEGIKCFLCNSYIGNAENCCMSEYFYCNDCRNSIKFIEVQINCYCDQCEKNKNFIVEQKKNLAKCSVCKKNNFKDFVSTCGKVIICVDCTKIIQYPNLIFSMLRQCDCAKCKKDQLSGLKVCSICLIIEFNTRNTSCENENFYCDNCVQNQFSKIFNVCTCNFCLSIISALMQQNGIPQFCWKCHTTLEGNFNCQISKFCCTNCWESDSIKINCTCGDHGKMKRLESINILLSSSKCVNCKRTSNFAVSCNHNQCFLCLIKINLKHFQSFFENCLNKNVRMIKKNFAFQCSFAGCNVTFDMSSGFCFKSLANIFSQVELEVLNCFLPYFDGIEFEFKVCKCEKVVGFNEEVSLGCGCLNY